MAGTDIISPLCIHFIRSVQAKYKNLIKTCKGIILPAVFITN